MLKAIIDALNSVSIQVWSIIQFGLLLMLVAFGGYLMLRGHADAGSPLIAGAFALLKFEASGKS